MKAIAICALMLCTIFLSSPENTYAQSKPSAESAKSFLDFYYKGQGKGVVLADMKVCTDVTNNECAETVDPSLLQVGMKYKIWMMFVVPEGDAIDSLSVQFSKDGMPQFNRDLSVKGSIRYRTWRNFNPAAAGIWEAKVMHSQEVELEELGKLSLVVSE